MRHLYIVQTNIVFAYTNTYHKANFHSLWFQSLAYYLPKISTYLKSNALDFVTQHLIGYRKKSATVYPDIHCMNQFDVIFMSIYHWMMCGVLLLGMLKFETKLQKCIRRGIIIFKIVIWGGKSSHIRCAEITFFKRLRCCKTKFSTVYLTIYLPK